MRNFVDRNTAPGAQFTKIKFLEQKELIVTTNLHDFVKNNNPYDFQKPVYAIEVLGIPNNCNAEVSVYHFGLSDYVNISLDYIDYLDNPAFNLDFKIKLNSFINPIFTSL